MSTVVLSESAVRRDRQQRVREDRHLRLVRIIAVAALALGLNYLAWRWLSSLNWAAAWIAVPLVLAETYSLIDVGLYALTMWRSRRRPAPPAAPEGLTVDVFVATYNEAPELVLATVEAAKRIRYPHRIWVLDDGNREELREGAALAGVGYLTRDAGWEGHDQHAKAGNLNNAMMATDGEFILVLDADQVPSPEILDRTLGYFDDPSIAFVQTPQSFRNVGRRDPLGSEAPLFYGPIQQGKDGWNAAFFCGSNAILRREALMQLAIAGYVRDVERSVRRALARADGVLRRAAATDSGKDPVLSAALASLRHALADTRAAVKDGEPVGLATFELQRRVDQIARDVVAIQLHQLALATADLGADTLADEAFDFSSAIEELAVGDASPFAALATVQALLRSIDVDRNDEAQPLMPLATNSVTEDMATAMRLHGAGWRSVYHHEDLAVGLAPEDFGTMLKQRLRWAQGTMQVMFRENPLLQRGLTIAQRLMYFATMWSYLAGFAAVVYFAAPVVFLLFGILPVDAGAPDFLVRFVPFLVVNQVFFLVAGRGIPTRRGRQYSLALFPIWIRATTTAAANVFFRRPLDFVVTAKSAQRTSRPWRLVRPQLLVAALLLVSAVVGVGRIVLGLAEPVGTLVNLLWVGVDLGALAVLVRAVRYQGFDSGKETA